MANQKKFGSSSYKIAEFTSFTRNNGCFHPFKEIGCDHPECGYNEMLIVPPTKLDFDRSQDGWSDRNWKPHIMTAGIARMVCLNVS